MIARAAREPAGLIDHLSPADWADAPVLPWRLLLGLIAVAFGTYLAWTNAPSAQVLGRAVGAVVQWFAGAPEP